MTYARTQADLARALDRSRRTIADWIKMRGFPAKTKRGWHIPSVTRWRDDRGTDPDVPDPLMVGVVSPALERYRMARAKLAELELRRKRRESLPTSAVQQGLAMFASTMRGAFETLRREFGQEPFAIVASALDDAEHMFERGMGKSKGNDMK